MCTSLQSFPFLQKISKANSNSHAAKVRVPAAKGDLLALTINSSLGQIALGVATQTLGRQESQVLAALPVTGSLCAGEQFIPSGL